MQTASASTRTPAVHPHYPISLSDLAQALDHSEEGFALTDPQGNYVYINDAHLRMYGYEKPQDLLGRSWRALYTPEWVRHFEESVLPIIPRDLVWRGQVIGKKRDGSSFLAGVTLTLLPDGKITCNCRDESIARVPPDAPQTNRGATTGSNERASLRELGERIVAGLPAKFRRPLEMLTGYSSFFLDELQGGRTPGADSLRQGIAEIDATGRQLAEQMRRLELVAGLAARDELKKNGVSQSHGSADWPRDLAASCEQKAASMGRSADLCTDIDHARIGLSFPELECVVLELLANAFQCSRPGDAVKVCGKIGPEGYELRVCDEGVGLDEAGFGDTDSRPFGQGNACGFGLALVRYILRKNGASIALDRSRAGVTCLKVMLPLR
jgi:PAS domain S-box-containing protein